MAKANENDKVRESEQDFAQGGIVGQDTEQPHDEREVEQPADGGGLRQRTEQDLVERRQVQEAEAFAPPAGEGARINPDAHRPDPTGEAKPTA